MKVLRSGLLSFVLLLPAAAFAHGEKTGPNGGVVEDVGKHHIELVMRADELRAFVTGDGGAKVDTKGAEASAVVLVGREKITLKLIPAGGNALAGSGKFEPRAGAKIVLTVSFPGQSAVSGRFSIPAKN